jgi:hypothetical protein
MARLIGWINPASAISTEQDGPKLYTQVLNHVSFKRALQVVIVLDQRKSNKTRYALFQ